MGGGLLTAGCGAVNCLLAWAQLPSQVQLYVYTILVSAFCSCCLPTSRCGMVVCCVRALFSKELLLGHQLVVSVSLPAHALRVCFASTAGTLRVGRTSCLMICRRLQLLLPRLALAKACMYNTYLQVFVC